MGDHTETVQVDFDPKRISYDRLLEIFWNQHRPKSPNWDRQYRNVIFYHDQRQQKLALESKTRVEQKFDGPVKTEIAPLRTFTPAEDYHQKYTLKYRPKLRDEMARIYPRESDFNDSTAVARLNGYAGGNGNREQLDREIDRLGLSPEGRQWLHDMVYP